MRYRIMSCTLHKKASCFLRLDTKILSDPEAALIMSI